MDDKSRRWLFAQHQSSCSFVAGFFPSDLLLFQTAPAAAHFRSGSCTAAQELEQLLEGTKPVEGRNENFMKAMPYYFQ
jgi:hypothetical protein